MTNFPSRAQPAVSLKLTKRPRLFWITSVTITFSIAAFAFFTGFHLGHFAHRRVIAITTGAPHIDDLLLCPKLMIHLGGDVSNSLSKFANGRFPTHSQTVANLTGAPFNSTEYCFVAFEADPQWTDTLRVKARHMQPYFRSIHIFTETVVDVKSGTGMVQPDPVARAIALQHSRNQPEGNQTQKKLRTVDFAAFLFDHTLPLSLDGPTKRQVIIRMDMGGMEYPILQNLVATGLLCNRVNYFVIDWHWEKFPENMKQEYIARTRSFQWFMNDHRCQSEFIQKRLPSKP